MGGFGFGAPFDPGGFFSALETIYQALISALVAAFTFLWTILQDVANFLWNAILQIVSFLETAVKAIASFFVHIWENVLKPFLSKVLAEYQKFRQWLKIHLGPYLKLIQKIQKWINVNIIAHIKQIIAIIQRVRQLLQIFRLLGFQWAAKLDAFLNKVQGYLTKTIQDILIVLNTASTVLGIVIDPSLLVRRNVWGGSLFQYFPAVKRAVGFGDDRALYPDEQDTQTNDLGLLRPGANIATRTGPGAVQLSPAMQQIADSQDTAATYYLQPVPKS
jgi:hypothetical protein